MVKVQVRGAGETVDIYFGCIPLLSLLVLCCWQRHSMQSSTFASVSARQKCVCAALNWKSDSRSVFNKTGHAPVQTTSSIIPSNLLFLSKVT